MKKKTIKDDKKNLIFMEASEPNNLNSELRQPSAAVAWAPIATI
jgi:hypothetical protein